MLHLLIDMVVHDFNNLLIMQECLNTTGPRSSLIAQGP